MIPSQLISNIYLNHAGANELHTNYSEKASRPFPYTPEEEETHKKRFPGQAHCKKSFTCSSDNAMQSHASAKKQLDREKDCSRIHKTNTQLCGAFCSPNCEVFFGFRILSTRGYLKREATFGCFIFCFVGTVSVCKKEGSRSTCFPRVPGILTTRSGWGRRFPSPRLITANQNSDDTMTNLVPSDTLV